MRWAVLMGAVVVFGCAPAESPPEHALVRQALAMPAFIGESGALLGSTLAECAGGGFVAGAPGTGSAWLTGTSAMPAPIGSNVGRAVACTGTQPSVVMVAGGSTGVRKVVGGAWMAAFTSSNVLSLSRSDDLQLPLLVGGTSSVSAFNASTGASIGTTLNGTTGFGAVVQWFPSPSHRFAVTQALGGNVQLYDYNVSNGTVSQALVLSQSFPGFGKALAVGDLFPTPGLEIAVGAEGAVFVFSEGGTLLMRLDGISQSFGSSLAIQRGIAPGLDALLAGEPALELVQRFIGDAGSVFTSIIAGNGENFGASVAIDSLNTLAVGAPTRGIGGAVYLQPMNQTLTLGEAQPCTVGMSCTTQSCLLGECLGGVFCDTGSDMYLCGTGQFCEMGTCLANGTDAGMRVDAGASADAGVSPDSGMSTIDDDAGVVDAGMPHPNDGGVVDAGRDAGLDGGVKPVDDGGMQKDAGNDADAGAMIFTTSGCSGVAGLPMLLLGLILLRRQSFRPCPLPRCGSSSVVATRHR